MGRRVRKRVETYNGSSWPETSDELFVYDGWNVVMVLNANASNAITRKYTWGLDLSGTLHGAGGIGGLLAAVETQSTSSELDDERYWFLYDANGNVGQVLDATDTNNITIAAHYEYDPYGNVINNLSSYSYATANPIRFSTKWFDAETGLGYWGYRYYSPRLGRWTSRDPIGERGGANLYAYVGNCPSQSTDPTGLAAPVAGAASAVVGGGTSFGVWETLGGIDLAIGAYQLLMGALSLGDDYPDISIQRGEHANLKFRSSEADRAQIMQAVDQMRSSSPGINDIRVYGHLKVEELDYGPNDWVYGLLFMESLPSDLSKLPDLLALFVTVQIGCRADGHVTVGGDHYPADECNNDAELAFSLEMGVCAYDYAWSTGFWRESHEFFRNHGTLVVECREE